MSNEIWKDIKGYEGLYQVSNAGQVRNISNLIKSNRPCTNGYLKTTLSKNGRKTTVLLHRIVSDAFISNPNSYKYVNHKNGIKTDNRVENLEWCTPKMNSQHSLRTGLTKVGEESGKAKHTEEQIIEVIELYNKGVQRKDIVEITGIHVGVIKGVRAKKRWKHLSHLFKDNYVK